MSIMLFEGETHAELYAKYRPKYPETLYETIGEFCRAPGASGTGVAVDVGCGSGQGTFPLCEMFDSVVGVDISQSQIEQAIRLQNFDQKYDTNKLNFRVGPAEDLSFREDNSVDLVSVAAAIHWLDTEKFYKEADRILKPGGSLIVYTYVLPDPDKEEAGALEAQFYKEHLSEYASSRMFPKLEDYKLPFDDEYGVRTVPMNHTLTVHEYVGFITTLSASQTYLQHNPSSAIFDDLTQRLLDLYTDPVTKEEMAMYTTSTVTLRTGRKPL
ncbi:putative methyltransferase DDB_G0268948 isoform X2 [Mizuhopecten yessoensis]|uniref:Methyltransferase n=1 Tax=Mizuhopecten yessoensis TaxID=6573 RepID=A0A210Q1U3_MIZYE|nr:putative methyltransferase DDB_G0268948 isoform X2 [Mizuhopecten yessoensis]XP_021369488.1 putative methyltransferase DDB_G0268948 isoform X2 [Mizuhopecten yessoensis]XP_021369489.1 putative methyltransferase DDB_G0268948 isoform X2 [Mizuhopecten yessoensis]XP_021369490.1 putative methyltransferase DDB_G0268948 isoform X2 [Mizuhopecten yessoensis]OWF42697.1 Methyltransferase [Mizuhopecten yessoensis]